MAKTQSRVNVPLKLGIPYPSSITRGSQPTDQNAGEKKSRRLFSYLVANKKFKKLVEDVRRKRKVSVPQYCRILKAMTIVVKIRKGKVRIPNVGRQEKAVEARHSYSKRVHEEDVVGILKTFNLTPLWYGPIRHHILSGEMWFPPRNNHIQPMVIEDPHGMRRMFIEIFADTKFEDVWHLWKSWKKEIDQGTLKIEGGKGGIEFYQKGLPGYEWKWSKSKIQHELEFLEGYEGDETPKDVVSKIPWENLAAWNRHVHRGQRIKQKLTSMGENLKR